MAFDQPVIKWSSELAGSIAANKAINDVEEYQKSFVCYASRGYMCEAANLSTIRTHSPNAAPITARLDIVAAPAEYCLPIKKDRRFAPEFTIQVTLGTATPGDVTAKVLACPFSETHRRALSTPVQQRLPQFLVNEALGKGQPASEEDRQKWYLSFKGQTSVSLHFDSQRDAVPHTGGNQTVMQKRGTFSGLEYLKSSHMERVYLLFVMTLGDSPDIIATLFTVPTIVICRASQRRLATERLGYQLSVYDDLRTRGCSYNLPSRKPGGATSPAAPPCRSAAAAAAAVAAAAVGCTDTRTNSSSGGGGGSKDSGSAAAAAAVAASVGAVVSGVAPSAVPLASDSYAALMNGTSQPLAVASEGGKQINAPLAMVQPNVASMNGLGAIFDLAPRPNNPPLHPACSDGSSGRARAGGVRAEGGSNAAARSAGGAHSRGSKGGSGSMDDDDELTQDEDDYGKVSVRSGDRGAGNNASSSARSCGLKRALNDAPVASTAAASTSKSPADALKAGATNLAWLRVGQQQLQHTYPEHSQPGVQEAHNLVSKLPRLTGPSEASPAAGGRAGVATGVPASISGPIKAEDNSVNGSLRSPTTSQPLQALLALCNSQSNKTHLTQQLAAVAGTAAPGSAAASAEQRASAPGSAPGGAAAAAAIASALRSATAATSISAPAAKKASALDIQKLYQLQAKRGSAAPASAGPAAPAVGLQQPPNSDATNMSAFGHLRGSNGAPMGPPNVMIGNTRFEMAVHEEVLNKSLFNPEVLAAIPTGAVTLPNSFSETHVRRAIEFLYSGKTSLDAENALMTLAVGAHLEAPALITYCFDYVIEWIQGTIGRWISPSFTSADTAAALAPQAGDRSSWTVGEKVSADGSGTGAVLPAALALNSATALGGVSQGLQVRRTSTTQPAVTQQQLREKPAEAFARVLEQYEPSMRGAALPQNGTSGSTPGAAPGKINAPTPASGGASDAPGQMELLLRIAQAQSANSGGSERPSLSSTSIAGLQEMLGSNTKTNGSLPLNSAHPAADAALQMSVSGVSTDTAGNITGFPAASAAAAAAAKALSVKRASEEGGPRGSARVSNDGGSLPITPIGAVKVPTITAPDGSPSQKKTTSGGGGGSRGVPRSPNCGASVAERRMHEQRAAEEERMRQLQLANESRELLAALLDSAQTTPEIMNNPQTVELAKHLLMSEQAARAAAGAAGQMASGYANPPAAPALPHS